MVTPAPDRAFSAEFITSLDAIPAARWNSVAGSDYPFLRHEFLYGLEKSACTTADTGWQPCHLLLRRGGELAAVMPLYLKSHSYGEYVFDWSWADAYHRAGMKYYPKLVVASPYTPATGPRGGAITGGRIMKEGEIPREKKGEGGYEKGKPRGGEK